MIGVDFGASQIKVADVREAEIQQIRSLDTARSSSPQRLLDAVAEAVQGLDPRPRSLGVAIPGEVDNEGRCWRLPNVPGFVGLRIDDELSNRIGCPVRVENDGTTAALAEALFGYGRVHRSFLMMTLGTGVGGGLVIDGTPQRGAHGFAGEVGHVPIEGGADAWPCGCGQRGCLEAYAGTAGLLRKFAELGGTASEIRDVAASARRGEEAGRRVFAMMGRALGRGLTAVQNLLDLDAIVFTGGVSRAFDLVEPALRENLRAHSFAPPLGELPLLVSELADRAGVIGAAHLPRRFPRG